MTDWELFLKNATTEQLMQASDDILFSLQRFGINAKSLSDIPEYRFWHTADGQKIRFMDMTDEHLANTLRWVKTHPYYSKSVITMIEGIVQRRNLTQEFIDAAPYPHRHGDDVVIDWVKQEK